MYRIVNAGVAGLKTAEQPGICRIDYSSAFQRRNIAFPKVNIILNRLHIGNINNALCRNLFFQKFVLNMQKILGNSFRRTDIYKTAEQVKTSFFIRGYL